MREHRVTHLRVALERRLERGEQALLPRLELRHHPRAQLHIVCDVMADEHLVCALRRQVDAGALQKRPFLSACFLVCVCPEPVLANDGRFDEKTDVERKGVL
jgi:hypothetical protein